MVFLDSDDYWDKDFLLCVLNALKNNPDAIMAYSNGYNVGENEIVIEERRINSTKPNMILPHILQYGRPWGTGACIWYKEKIKHINWLEYRTWEDYAFDVSAAMICNSIVAVNDYLIYYDISGVDKLSKYETVDNILEKNKVLKKISNQILKSDFFNNILIKKGIVRHVVNNTIALLNYKIINKEYYLTNKTILKVYNGYLITTLLFIGIKLNNKLGLFLLRRLRHKLL